MSFLEAIAALLAGGDAASAAEMLRGIEPAGLSDDDRVVAVLLAVEAGVIGDNYFCR